MTLVFAVIALLVVGAVSLRVGRRYGVAKGIVAALGTLALSVGAWILLVTVLLRGMG